MGIIQKQSIRSTIFIMIGFSVGAINMVLLAPKLLTTSQIGLTRIITDVAITLATMCTLGSLPIVYKFFPFYKSYLAPKKNDLPFLTLMVCFLGFIVMCITGYLFKDIIIRKFSERSPLFVEYSYLVYPFAFFYLAYMWLESFGWSFKKGVISNTLREVAPRILFTLLLFLFASHIISLKPFLALFSLSYLLPAIILFFVLRGTKEFFFNTTISNLTLRLKSRMINFGLFLFGAQFLNLLSRTADTFILSATSEKGLTDVAVFSIGTYVVALMEVPQRSINAISIPVLAEAWKNKDLDNISYIYTKSVTNLLIVGLAMFSLLLLNAHNLAIYMGSDFKGIEMVVFFLGIGKLVDLGTGANAQIIGTSNYWKVDFTTNVIYTLIALPLNYILITHYGLMGAAYSTLISVTFYNLMRFGFLWYKFGLQPYRWKDILVIIIAVAAGFITYSIPRISSVFVDTAMRTSIFSLLFFSAVYLTGISAEVNQIIKKYTRFIARFITLK
jgi:O-antigen/teichoic acid export membrane protein